MSTTSVTAAGRSEIKTPPPQPKHTEIDPSLVLVNNDGARWREIFVRTPNRFNASDLSDPAIWKRVQRTSAALRKFDHLLVVSFDETWCAEVIVGDANHDRVVLTKPRIVDLQTNRYDALFEDEKYRLRWTGSDYAIERKTDGAIVAAGFANEKLAEREVGRMYPRRV